MFCSLGLVYCCGCVLFVGCLLFVWLTVVDVIPLIAIRFGYFGIVLIVLLFDCMLLCPLFHVICYLLLVHFVRWFVELSFGFVLGILDVVCFCCDCGLILDC